MQNNSDLDKEQTTSEAPVSQPSANVPVVNQNNKPFIIIGAILGALLIVGIIAWAVYASVFAVSKEDYRQAVKVGNEVVSEANSSYSDLTKVSYISSYSTETKSKNDIKSATESLDKYKKENDKFKDLKALRNSDVKEAYDEYMKKYSAYVSFAESYLKSAEKVLPAVLECEDLSSASVKDVASFKATVAPCKDALDSIGDVDNKDLKAFAEAYINNVDEITSIVDQSASLSSSDYAKRSALRTQLLSETKKLQDAQKDTNSNIEKQIKDVSPRNAYNKLGDVLEDKQRK